MAGNTNNGGNIRYLYSYSDDQPCLLRLNDFPDEPFLTLINGPGRLDHTRFKRKIDILDNDSMSMSSTLMKLICNGINNVPVTCVLSSMFILFSHCSASKKGSEALLRISLTSMLIYASMFLCGKYYDFPYQNLTKPKTILYNIGS